jgi:cell volume regulation protein A
MSPVAIFLLTIAGIFLVGAFGEIVFRRTNIPDVVWLILVGILLGPVGGVISRQQLGAIAPYFAALALVVVLFEGGSRLRLLELTQAAPRAAALAILTFTLATGAVALASMGAAAVGWLPDTWTWLHAVLLGTMLGGSSSIIIMPAMAQAKLDGKVSNLVNLESGFTDVLCVVGASACIDMLVRGPDSNSAPAAVLQSFGLGIAIGGAAGLLWLFLLRALRGNEHAYPLTLAALLVLYVVIDKTRGSAALGVLTFAVILGNAGLIGRAVGLMGKLELGSDVRGVHSQITFIIKSFFFTFIGCMLGPPWSLMLLGVLLGGLLLAARIPGVYAATFHSTLDKADKEMVTVSMPRGMAAGVLATLPAAAGIVGTEELPTVVFACVLTTVLIFAVGFPLVKNRAGIRPEGAEPSPHSGKSELDSGSVAADRFTPPS